MSGGRDNGNAAALPYHYGRADLLVRPYPAHAVVDIIPIYLYFSVCGNRKDLAAERVESRIGIVLENAAHQRGFLSTRWGEVQVAADHQDASRLQTLETLLRQYCPTLKEFLSRHFGLSETDAQDIVQGFVCDRILRQNLLSRAAKERGRFRTFLLKSIQNYYRDQVRRQNAVKRKPEHGWMSLDEIPDEAHGFAVDSSAQEDFDDSFTRQIIGQTLHQMHASCLETGKRDVWEIFHSRVVHPLLYDDPPESCEALMREFGYETVSIVYQKLNGAKRLFRESLRKIVSDFTVDREELESEIAYFKRFLENT